MSDSDESMAQRGRKPEFISAVHNAYSRYHAELARASGLQNVLERECAKVDAAILLQRELEEIGATVVDYGTANTAEL